MERWRIGLVLITLFVFFLYGAQAELKLKQHMDQNLCYKKLSDYQYVGCIVDCSNQLYACQKLINDLQNIKNFERNNIGREIWNITKAE